MNRRLFATTVIVGMMVFGAGPALGGDPFEGEFAQLSDTGSPCDEIFTPRQCGVEHFRTGPTRRTSVMYFDRDGEDNGFFDNMSLVSLYGPSGDVYYEKTLAGAAGEYDILMEGIVDREFVILAAEVILLSREDGSELCRATAEFSAFR